MKRVVLGLQYDGAPWHGWQTQANCKTVQDRLEAALGEFTRTKIQTHCAGRTDAGVHALGQVVHFDTLIDRSVGAWVRGVNAFLPDSIAVRWAKVLPADSPDGFHARFSAHARTYYYVLYNHPVRSPIMVGKAGWAFRRLDTESMQSAANMLLGIHDFTAFRAAECQAKSASKTMYDINIMRRGDLIVFSFKANAFLHHMVRNIVGSLVQIGCARQPTDWMREVLLSKERSRAGPTFMPDGLYLAKIDYDAIWQLPQESAPAFAWF